MPPIKELWRCEYVRARFFTFLNLFFLCNVAIVYRLDPTGLIALCCLTACVLTITVLDLILAIDFYELEKLRKENERLEKELEEENEP